MTIIEVLARVAIEVYLVWVGWKDNAFHSPGQKVQLGINGEVHVRERSSRGRIAGDVEVEIQSTLFPRRCKHVWVDRVESSDRTALEQLQLATFIEGPLDVHRSVEEGLHSGH